MRIVAVFLLSIFIATNFLYASMNDFLRLYKAKKYSLACSAGSKMLKENRRNENFVQAYSVACLRSDNIDSIAFSSVYIKHSKEARINAALFSSLVAIKKLLYMSLVDNVDISSLRLPKIDHILSDVFDRFTKKKYTKEGDTFVFNLENGRRITMELKFEQNKHKIYIKDFMQNKLKKTHIYW